MLTFLLRLWCWTWSQLSAQATPACFTSKPWQRRLKQLNWSRCCPACDFACSGHIDFACSGHILYVFGLGYYSSPDLPCGQKDWRKVENKAKVHQARPNCHCQVRNQPQMGDICYMVYASTQNKWINFCIFIEWLVSTTFCAINVNCARFTATHPICMETFKAHPQLGRFTLRDEGDQKFFLWLFRPGFWCFHPCAFQEQRLR